MRRTDLKTDRNQPRRSMQTIIGRISRISMLSMAAVLVGIMSVTAWTAQAQSADEIMATADNRFEGNSFTSQVRLATVDAQGQVTEMLMEMMTKVQEASLATEEYRYTIFARVLEPEDSRGVAVLVWESVWPSSDDIWLYLSALGSTKKIVQENFRTSMFGSEFTFEELTEREPMKDVHEFLRVDRILDMDAWVIKSATTTPDADGFAYRISWVLQEWHLPVRIELYDSNDQLLKVFSADEVEEIDGIPTRVKSTAENLETGRTSTFEFIDPRYDMDVPDAVFDPERMGEGI